MSYRIIIAACLFPTVACAGPVAIGGANGFSVASNGAVVSVLNSPTGFTVSGHQPGGSQSISVGPGPGSASATASSVGTFELDLVDGSRRGLCPQRDRSRCVRNRDDQFGEQQRW